ncbi:MAG: efflux RND transporter periplasmic adaptor subunit [Candidatus Competibacter sp.]|nr:efflux RND transporter periplasmic adaptor subunit [Candidatus Competibacter sp.]MDG4607491.1 efflux RND transporter periplasmic adaptor subunit [Candidatus Contendobacter sp.]HRD50330.1 efflux RND transporter periplasmic adaptor subunit [Candidatus Contendobacter sp.]
MKSKLLWLAALAILPLLMAFRWPWTGAGDSERIELSGSVEAREVDLAFQVGGRVARLLVDEGDAVQADQPVAALDASDCQLALRAATAQMESAQAALAALQAGARVQELRVAEAQLARAQADLDFARADLKRFADLALRKLAPEDQLDQAQLRQNVALAGVEQARQTLALLREGPRREDIERAAAELRARQAAVETAQRQLDYTRLHSPVTGVVAVRLAESGEVVSSGKSVLRITELSHPWVRAYLNEADLPRVRLGQAAEVRVDGLPGKVLNGRLSFISPDAEFTPKTVETRALRVDLVYRVKVEVANPDGALKRGQPADVALKAAAP